jgi:hypothetical protein
VNVPLTQKFMRQTSRKRMIAAHNVAVQRRHAATCPLAQALAPKG